MLAIVESSIKIKVKLDLTFSVILLTSTAICKQKVLHRNEIVQDLQNCKYYNDDQYPFRMPS